MKFLLLIFLFVSSSVFAQESDQVEQLLIEAETAERLRNYDRVQNVLERIQQEQNTPSSSYTEIDLRVQVLKAFSLYRAYKYTEVITRVEAILPKLKGTSLNGTFLHVKLISVLGWSYLNQESEKGEQYIADALGQLQNNQDELAQLLVLKNKNKLIKFYIHNRQYYSKAGVLLNEIESITSKNKDKNSNWSRLYISVQMSKSNLYRQKGIYQEALDVLNQVYELNPGIRNQLTVEVIELLNLTASLHALIGNFQLAISFYKEVLSKEKQLLGEEHGNYASTLNNLALVYQDMGLYEEAKEILLQALEVKKNRYGVKSLSYGSTLNSYAVYLYNIKKLGEAVSAWEQVELIYSQYPGNVEDKAMLVYNMVKAYMQLKQYPKALKKLEGVAILAKDGAAKLFSYNRILITKIELYNKIKDAENVELSIQEAMQSLVGGSANPIFSQEWFNDFEQKEITSYVQATLIGQIFVQSYIYLSWAPAIEQRKIKIREIPRVVKNMWQKTQSLTLSDEDKLRVLKNKKQAIEYYVNSLSDAQKDKAYKLANQSKSVLLFASMKAHQGKEMGILPSDIEAKEKQLKQECTKLQASLLNSAVNKDSLQQQLNMNNELRLKLQELIERDYPKYAALQQIEADFSVKDIQAKLSEDAALIEYLITGSVLHIFRIDTDGLQWSKVPIKAKSFDKDLQRFRDLIVNLDAFKENRKETYKEYTALAHSLYKQLLEPVLKDKKSVKQLIIVPQSKIAYLPFETLLTAEVDTNSIKNINFGRLPYLLYDYSVTYHYSASLWLESMKMNKREHNNKLLGIASSYDLSDVELQSTIKNRTLEEQQLRKDLVPLPFAKEEVKRLEEKYAGTYLYGNQATEREVKRIMDEYGVLHFAMHSLMNKKHPILSSLILTDDGDSLENGMLYSYEVSKRELNADLVVLSACETGTGKYESGNGIASLARAFMYANVPSMIVSQWQINDQATALIMQFFYANLEKGMTKDKALQEAKIEFLNRTEGIMQHPLYWSSFIQIGNHQPIALQAKNNWTYYWLYGGVTLLLFVLIGIKLRKAQ